MKRVLCCLLLGAMFLSLCCCTPDAPAAEELRAELEAKYPRAEVILQAGGQPVYEYILVLF